MLGGGAVLGAGRPAPLAFDHVPPHAVELARVHPTHVAQFVGLVQIKLDVAHVEAGRVVGDDHRSEEHTSELQSLMRISYAVFCLKKKKRKNNSIDMTVQRHYTNHNYYNLIKQTIQ